MKKTLVAAALAALVTPTGATVVDAIECYHAGLDEYFVTSSRAEIEVLDGLRVWNRTGERFLVDEIPADGTRPVCRFARTSFSSHFYTASERECSIVKSNPDWKSEGIAFHVATPAADGSCASGFQVFRLYNNAKGGAPSHRYTMSIWIAGVMEAQGWTPEAVAFCTSVPIPPVQPDRVPTGAPIDVPGDPKDCCPLPPVLPPGRVPPPDPCQLRGGHYCPAAMMPANPTTARTRPS